MRSAFVLLVILASAPASAAPRGFVDAQAGLGLMAGAPETVAGIVEGGVRGGVWLPGTTLGLEVAVDGATLKSPDPEGFDESHWSDTSITRFRALGGVRFTSDRTQRTVYFGRLAIGAERVAISTTTWSDQNEDKRRVHGSDLAPTLELSAGFLIGTGSPRSGVELAMSTVGHDGGYLDGFTLTYDALAFELRLVIDLDL